MYNRYIPQDLSYTWAEETERSGPAKPSGGLWHILGSLGRKEDTEGEQGLLSGILSHIHLEKLDTGDYLILAVAALLFVEGEDVDLAIALALVFLLGFGETDHQD